MPGAILASRSLRHSVKRITFLGTPGNPGVQNVADTVFKITGTVILLFQTARVITSLSAAGTLQLGVTGNANSMIAATNANALTQGLLWKDNTPETGNHVALINNVVCADVIQTAGAANITSGVIEYSAWWVPMSFDGNLT